MTREDKFKIGMAIHKIAMSVDNNTLHKIEPFLKEIENITSRQIDTVNIPIIGDTEDDLSGIFENERAENDSGRI